MLWFSYERDERMANINLLPWRETLREEQKKEFLMIFAGVIVLTGIVLILTHLFMMNRITYHQERNAYLQKEIVLLDAKIEEIKNLKRLKAALIARMGIIQELQLQRPRVVHLFDDMISILPKGIHFKKVVLRNSSIELQGISESNTSISKLMRNINDSRWLDRPILSEIKTKEVNGVQISEFHLRSILNNPKRVVQ